MPVFNARFGEEAAADDERVLGPPSARLHRLGPLLPVVLVLPEDRAQELADAGEKVEPVLGYAMIDTGAMMTCFDTQAAERAQLAAVDTAIVSSATHDAYEVPVFAGVLDFVGFPGSVNAPRAYGANLTAQNLIALIGRDVLQHCLLVYNGTDGSFSFSV